MQQSPSSKDCMMSLEQFQDTHFTSAQMLRADPRMRRMSDPVDSEFLIFLRSLAAETEGNRFLIGWEGFVCSPNPIII